MVETASQVLEPQFVALIATEIGCQPHQVTAASGLFAEGATVPFVARYRKEVTGGLDDEQLENLHKRREYFLELANRRDAILASIAEQEKLTPELESAIRSSSSRQELEDLYLPYKKKRRTRAQMARERGLEPLAESLLEKASGSDDPVAMAESFVSEENEVPDVEAALAGARDILAEQMAEDVENRTTLRKTMSEEGMLTVRVASGKETEGAVYRDYFDHTERGSNIPSHRLLAILRGEREGFLISDLEIDDDAEVRRISLRWQVPLNTPCGEQVALATSDGYKRLLRPSITNEVRSDMRERAENEAISVFRSNLEALLMQSPFGRYPVMGVDPGERTGSKIAVVDDTTKVVATTTIYPLPPRADVDGSQQTVIDLAKRHSIRAIAIGNGTGSRDTERIIRQAVKRAGMNDIVVAIVPETGASVYSASKIAREEFPDLDVSIRGAVSIARRLQDPLAELVKIEPKSMGVGQYQHDVNQKSLEKELDLAVEGVVNKVGVELNTASHPLLARVSGISTRIAKAIVSHRDSNGPFGARDGLMEVRGLGSKTYEQAAGFLRIHAASNPLDRTAVHPERYDLVNKMVSDAGVSLEELVGNPTLVNKLDLNKFIDEKAGIGTFTLNDIRDELKQPGRDPRPEYEAPSFREDVVSIDDLQEGMILEGRVSNVANFGAFVDLGIKRDGLIHISELTHEWVDDPRKVVQVGQVVKVKVIEIDHQRGRVGLSRKALEAGPAVEGHGSGGGRPRDDRRQGGGNRSQSGGHREQNSSRRGGGNQSRQGVSRNQAPKPSGPVTMNDLLKKFGK
ncbi:MAG: RNA-binding transcriptional accessory protein [Deltaproteobacteria bacterium]|nr:MAG: RNA-binding transcriptional accessory protein [Deltaproteobacteria bacterium]